MHKPRPTEKYLIYFAMTFIALQLIQTVVLNRLISYGEWSITGGAYVYLVLPLISDVITEVYGFRIARNIVIFSLITVLGLALVIEIVIHASSPSYWIKTNEAYSIALGSLPRTALLGSLCILAGQLINAMLLSHWRVLLHGRYFWLRSVGSTVIGDGFTVLSSIFLNLGDRATLTEALHTAIPVFIAMLVITAIGALPAWKIACITAQAEGRDNYYDKSFSFNPFK